MKHISALLLLASALNASAQLTNGSFEVNGNFTLQGWEWTCDEPQAVLDVPNGGGVWSAWKESGHAKGCFPNQLFQRLPNVQYGIPYQLSGWVKCPVGDFALCIGGSIGFGTISNGQFALAQMSTSTDPEWAFVTAEHVFDPGVGDTAIVVLNSGFIGGPIDPLPAGFDQLTLLAATSVNEPSPLRISIFPNPTTDRLNVGCTAALNRIELFDATGRRVMQQPAAGTTEVVDVSKLSDGQYLLRATSKAGTLTKRFVKH